MFLGKIKLRWKNLPFSNYNWGVLVLNVFIKMFIKKSWIPSVLYDAKSKPAETWCNCTADDTQSIPSAWWCVFPNDSALCTPVEILWIGLAGIKAGQRNFPLLCNVLPSFAMDNVICLHHHGSGIVVMHLSVTILFNGLLPVFSFCSVFIGNRDIQWLLTCIWAKIN